MIFPSRFGVGLLRMGRMTTGKKSQFIFALLGTAVNVKDLA
jgi:hypothetical protein